MIKQDLPLLSINSRRLISHIYSIPAGDMATRCTHSQARSKTTLTRDLDFNSLQLLQK